MDLVLFSLKMTMITRFLEDIMIRYQFHNIDMFGDNESSVNSQRGVGISKGLRDT